MKRLRNSLLVTLLMASAYLATAQTVPPEMNFQGLLVDSADQPLEGNQDLTFRIFDQATDGTLKWGPQTKAVVVYQGQFNTVLGPTDEGGQPLIDAFLGPSCYLEIQVGSNTPIQPRQQILSAPFALNSTLLDGQGWNVVFDNGDPTTGKIDGAKLADGSVTSLQLGAAAVVAENLAPDAINTGTIADGGVTSADILDNSVTSGDVEDGTITSADIADNSVTSSDVQDRSISSVDIATEAVTSNEIRNDTITSADIKDGTIGQEDVAYLYRLSASDGAPSNALNIDSLGNVGIGTAAPLERLSVDGGAAILGPLDSTTTAGYRSRPSTEFNRYGMRLNLSPEQYWGGVGIYGSQEGGSSKAGMVYYEDSNALLLFNANGGDLRLSAAGTGIRLLNLQSGSGDVLRVDSSGYVKRESSSRRYKENIQPAKEEFEKVLHLQPRTFNYKSEPNGPTQIGYIAEELDAAGLSAVTRYDEQGRPDAVDYSRLVIYSNEILKKHQATIEEQQQKIDTLESELESLKEMVRAMTHHQ